MRFLFILLILFINISISFAQNLNDSTKIEKEILDSLFISETEDVKGPDKVLHAEPLFIDLIRDLGARAGEKEWNYGFGLNDNTRYDAYTGLIEYEFAPINRLGFEFELPFTFYQAVENISPDSIPSSKINSLKFASQYSFFVSEKIKTSMAIGYIHEFEMVPFKDYSNQKYFNGNIFSPFFVAAKRWGNNFHTLIYTGPIWETFYNQNPTKFSYQLNSNLHYMISGTRNFIGLEINKDWTKNDFDMVLRPQMRLGITDNLLIGILTGIPVKRENERFSMFIRLIYEPGHKH